jgi:aminoglycoside phosphotransferase (APT) family kinase protein
MSEDGLHPGASAAQREVLDEARIMADRLLTALADDSGIGDSGIGERGEARIIGLRRLSGGANMETWAFDLEVAGAIEPLILRRLPGGAAAAASAPAIASGSAAQGSSHSAKPGAGVSAVGELTLADEAALITVSGQFAVPVPTIRQVLQPEHALGQGYIMSRERGEALPFRLLADACYHDAREKLAFQCGQTLARIHQVPLSALPSSLPDHSGVLLLQRAQALLDSYGNVSPVLQLGLNWLRDRQPDHQPDHEPFRQRSASRRALVHGDFRNGNLLVDEHGLVAVLDWELAHIGDPVQDLGYISANVWRFGSPKPVGGFGEYTDLLAGYASVSGEVPSMVDIHYWQVHAALSWGMVCLLMLQMYRSGQDTSLERAAIGRRLSEAEIDLLLLMDTEPDGELS